MLLVDTENNRLLIRVTTLTQEVRIFWRRASALIQDSAVKVFVLYSRSSTSSLSLSSALPLAYNSDIAVNMNHNFIRAREAVFDTLLE